MATKHNSSNAVADLALARNAILNLIGQGAPLLAALVAFPLLLAGLGTDRFGVLSLAWVIVGYFSLFDFGLGRALTKLVAEKLGTEERSEIPALVWSALLLLAVMGVAGGLLAAMLSPWLVTKVLKIPYELQHETLRAFYLLAISIPFVISATGLRGVLEAQQRFGLVNAVRIPLGIFTLCAPLAVLPFSKSLVPVIALLVGVRVVAWATHLVLCLRSLPILRDETAVHLAAMGQLFRLGTWMTVSNIVGPLMVYLDRFLIGALMSVAAVAYYAAPYDVITKLWLVSGAFASVLFPTFTTALTQDPARAARLYASGVKFIFLAIYPVTLVVVTLASEGLDLWLGADFARNSAPVLQLLAVGVLINSVTQIPFTLVQAAGRADLNAKLHLLELPLYLAGVYWLVGLFGIEGAALGWVARVGLDWLVLWMVLARKFVPAGDRRQRAQFAAALSAAALAVGFFLTGTAVKLVFLGVMLTTFFLVAWFLLLRPGEKALLRHPSRLLEGSE
jgi:O-antigen/teichoic acid export membrane protein